MKVVAIVQARMGSTRLPGKVMEPISGIPMLQVLLGRLSRSKLITQIIVATTIDPADQAIGSLVKWLGYECEFGSEKNILERFVSAATKYEADVVVRITGDCPLVDPELVDQVIDAFFANGADYASNVAVATFPDGMDVEVFSYSALIKSADYANTDYDREHVTPRLRQKPFVNFSVENSEDLSVLRWTVDVTEDLSVVRNIFDHFSPDLYFSWGKVAELNKIQPELFAANKENQRNEGAKMGTGQKLWQRAKSVIPGGNMLLSKRPEMFLPGNWPAYFSKSKGCEVWDLDNNRFIDMSIMGVGTNILGYGNEEVDDAVRRAIGNGNMSTLNCPEEVYLAEKLIELHPWADMVKFARSGGEANAIAIRIARASSGKDNVAVCGYHGWHDWYLSANLGNDENLSGHLLPGLEPIGVPNNLKNTVFPFQYNDYEALKSLVEKHNIGTIKMEVVRNKGPENSFLKKVRQLATDKGIILIFDECTSGFRQNLGGIHKLYGVEPDMAMFGKALGNGYAITAVIGREIIMEAAQSTFISSTFWTERIGPSAALKTLEVMEKTRAYKYITEKGLKIRAGWQGLADKCDLKIEHWGIPALTGFSFKDENALLYKTFITQEMLKNGFLASNSIYVSLAHTDEIIDEYFYCLEPLFGKIADEQAGNKNSIKLNGPICHSGFKRLN